jgi:hypothetical protein
MAKTLKRSVEFQVEQRQADEAVQSASFRLVSQTDQRLVFEVVSREYERGLAGLDRSKTLETVTRTEWDLKALERTWVYTNPAVDRLKLSGADHIEVAGTGARLVTETTVEVRIPIVGGKIEKGVIDGMDRAGTHGDERVRRYCAKLA